MSAEDADFRCMLESASIKLEPDPDRVRAAHDRMMRIARGPRRHRGRRTVVVAGLIVVGVSAVGLGGTQAGRKLLRSVLTPVKRLYIVGWHGPIESSVTTRPGQPATPEDAKSIPAQSPDANSTGQYVGTVFGAVFAVGDEPPSTGAADSTMQGMHETDQIARAGGGRLIGLTEAPGMFGYLVEYTLRNGEVCPVGSNFLHPKQRISMRSDEIVQLRNAGAGQIISQEKCLIGLGKFVIRFSLSDGQTVDLQTQYPPMTAKALEAIFEETRTLKTSHRFTVVEAYAAPRAPNAASHEVHGVLRYTLADGRTVGIMERVPPVLISPDGKWVVMRETQERVEIQKP